MYPQSSSLSRVQLLNPLHAQFVSLFISHWERKGLLFKIKIKNKNYMTPMIPRGCYFCSATYMIWIEWWKLPLRPISSQIYCIWLGKIINYIGIVPSASLRSENWKEPHASRVWSILDQQKPKDPHNIWKWRTIYKTHKHRNRSIMETVYCSNLRSN